MRIALCDDLKTDSENLITLLKQYASSHTLTFDISTFTSGDLFLESFEKDKYDVVFLDIYMGDTFGIDVAKKIRETDKFVSIIFTTTTDEFFKDGFEVNATHYLIKPITKEALSESLSRVDSILNNTSDLVMIPGNKDQVKLPQSKIFYIETIRNGIKIHFEDESLEFRYSLAKIESQLNESFFLRTHRSYIVNMNYISDVTNDSFILENGDEVLLRQKEKAALKHKYADFKIQQLSEVL